MWFHFPVTSPYEKEPVAPGAQFPVKASHEQGRGLGLLPLVPIFVVEEHHEALPYWRCSGVRGGFLLHFDAHPDMAGPANRHGEQLGMANNDEFIVAAAMDGIIDRVLWIWPSWDREGPRHLHKLGSENAVSVRSLSVGRAADGEPCFCDGAWRDVISADWRGPADDSARGPATCYSPNDADVEDCVTGPRLIFASVEESLFNASAPWAQDFFHGVGILDIDEDHMGQHSAGDPLYFVPDDIEDLVAGFSCANETLGAPIEAALDSEIRTIVDLALRCQHGQGSCEMPTMVTSEASDILAFAAACNSNSLRNLWEGFLRLMPETLELFAIYGFCFNTSPRTASPDTPRRLVICREGHGDARLDTYRGHGTETLAQEPAAIAGRLQVLHDTLEQFGRHFAPRLALATICRSVRDGYTPRRTWGDIESSLLRYLGGKPTFDTYLLGGQGGWINWTRPRSLWAAL